ncbi:MAG TPA: heavy metal translocating P-type ATPase, partial [Herpetosiphonaceae bacterium]
MGRLPGVTQVSASFATSKLSVSYDTAQLDRTAIIQRVEELGYGVAEHGGGRAQSNVLVFTVSGMDCADCAANIERQVAYLPGARRVTVNFMATKLTVEADDPSSAFATRIQQAVHDAGYRATPVTDKSTAMEPQGRWQRYAKLLPTVIAAALWALAFSLGFGDVSPLLVNALYAAAIVIGGYRIARSGYYALVRGRTIGIDLLMTIAVIGAGAIGEWSEGAAVVVLFALGNLLESLTTDKARHAIRALMDLSPREATIKTPDGEQRVPVEALMPGDVVVIRPGEQVSADGHVVRGSTTINQAAITGESLPVTKRVGDDVFAGTLNERGFVEVAVTKRAEDTTLSKIIHLVEEAQGTKAPAQRFVDQFATSYTPAVIVLAVLVAALPPLLGEPFLPWLERALVLLVIACPCALVISTPVAIVAGIGRASRSGVLIKGGAYLEAMGGIRAIAFDKTGTLTHGQPTVTDIVPLAALNPDEVLALAAAVESRSEHPLAGAILRSAQERGLTYVQPEQFEALTGRGAQATIAGLPIVIGSAALFPSLSDHIQAQLTAFQEAGKTALLLGRGNEAIGIIAVADQ